uniref:lysophosphatidic acid phosphatase type 6-like n=1 Tax=Ciona intestinalis TaxID=7719 RepID=UPI00089DBFFE|nr:lysophosphatidic acid phosphatase type 6-like [Ciona intestinalis]|eukprot:XP_018671244.1 lysophosphatidic acid phosphatase type 6-like [Ciona intestinalis]
MFILDIEMRLRKVILIVRHGTRTPCFAGDTLDGRVFPTELTDLPESSVSTKRTGLGGIEPPFSTRDESYKNMKTLIGGECGFGQLTRKGATDQYNLGLKLRGNYGKGDSALVKPEYDPSDIIVRSTNIKRTVDSAKYILAGLYEGQKRNPTIPIYVTEDIEKNEGDIIETKIDFIIERTEHLIKDSKHLPGQNELARELTRLLKSKETNMYVMVDNLLTLDHLGIPLSIPDETWKRVKDWSFKISSLCTLGRKEERLELLPLLCGTLIDDFLHKLELPMDETPNMYLYSGHDATLMRILTALRIEIHSVPSPSSVVAIEIYQDDTNMQTYAKVLYNWMEQLIRGGKVSLITFKHFKDVLSPYRMSLKRFKSICDSKR